MISSVVSGIYCEKNAVKSYISDAKQAKALSWIEDYAKDGGPGAI